MPEVKSESASLFVLGSYPLRLLSGMRPSYEFNHAFSLTKGVGSPRPPDPFSSHIEPDVSLVAALTAHGVSLPFAHQGRFCTLGPAWLQHGLALFGLQCAGDQHFSLVTTLLTLTDFFECLFHHGNLRKLG